MEAISLLWKEKLKSGTFVSAFGGSGILAFVLLPKYTFTASLIVGSSVVCLMGTGLFAAGLVEVVIDCWEPPGQSDSPHAS